MPEKDKSFTTENSQSFATENTAENSMKNSMTKTPAPKTLHLFSWNVNGLRAVLRKNALQEFLQTENPDILCLQETKASRSQIEVDFPDYIEFWNSAARPGYSGTAIFVKNDIAKTFQLAPAEETSATDDLPLFSNSEKSIPENSKYSPHFPESIAEKFQLNSADDFGAPNSEGRLQTLEFPNFFLINTYVPNAKPNLERLKLRENNWDPALREYLQSLNKPVVICGDFNVAHAEIDLARPKENRDHAGFTDEERRGMNNFLNSDLTDTFRFLHPDSQRYTWWSHWGNARTNNVGWRIDYFLISTNLTKNLKSAEIYEHIFGSDHCPISITLEFWHGRLFY